MHYTGMLGLRVAGTMSFDPGLVAASAVIAVVAATVALWFTTMVRGWMPIVVAATVMAVAVCGMHYTGMAALRVQLAPEPVQVHGISPFLLIVPITLVSAAALIGTAISALQAMMEEEFDGERHGRHRGGAHGEVPWTLQEPRVVVTGEAPVPVPYAP
jgi:NO-binding membrane sensor protein with MHYT domain